MKRILLIAAVLLLAVPTVSAQRVRYRILQNEGRRAGGWAIVDDIPNSAKGATVYAADGTEIPSQADDLDGDGVLDELVFCVADAPCEVEVVYRDKAVGHDYKPLVNAQMWWKNDDKTLTESRVLSSEKDDMYRKLHHHGPAFESEYTAYRIYFDKKQSVDTYGKKRPALELRETMWYPSREQLAAGYGHDNLRVFGSVSVGALKGWNAATGTAEHIVDMRRREAAIRAAGPLRTVVDMRVEGWQYGGREINMTSRYILYGGGSAVKVENRIEGDSVDGLQFATGVMKMARNGGLHHECDDRMCLLSTVGEDFPENDTLVWERETMGLAVVLPAAQVVSQIDDALSWLCQLQPVDGRIDYWLCAAWRKSGFLNEEERENPSLAAAREAQAAVGSELRAVRILKHKRIKGRLSVGTRRRQQP